MTTKFNTWYMDRALFNLSGVIKQAQEDLKNVDFDTVVGTGFSGAVVVPALALAMGKKFVLVRKENDDSHHGKGRLLGELGERWIFVDDFVASGDTRARVIKKIAESPRNPGDPEVELIGEYLYCSFAGFEPRRASWADIDW